MNKQNLSTNKANQPSVDVTIKPAPQHHVLANTRFDVVDNGVRASVYGESRKITSDSVVPTSYSRGRIHTPIRDVNFSTRLPHTHGPGPAWPGVPAEASDDSSLAPSETLGVPTGSLLIPRPHGFQVLVPPGSRLVQVRPGAWFWIVPEDGGFK